MTRQLPASITAYWSTEDPTNPGWAWRAVYTDDEGFPYREESGAFDGRESLKDASVVSRARKAAGASRSTVPVRIVR